MRKINFMICFFAMTTLSLFSAQSESENVRIYTETQKESIRKVFHRLAAQLNLTAKDSLNITPEQINSRAWSTDQASIVRLFCVYLEHPVIIEVKAIVRKVAGEFLNTRLECLRDDKAAQHFTNRAKLENKRRQIEVKTGKKR